LREGRQSAEVVVVTKSGESRMSEGPKNERTKLSEKLEQRTEQSSEAAERGNCGHDSAGQASPRRCGRLKRCEREGEARSSARLNTESNVREPDGTGRHEGKRHGSLAGGQTQRRRAGDRSNDDRATGRTHPQALGEAQREIAGRHLRAQPSQARGDTQTQWRNTDAGHPDGGGQVDTANAFAGAATHL